VRSCGREHSVLDREFDFVVDHALLNDAEGGDAIPAVRQQAAHLGGAEEAQVPAIGVEQGQRFDDEGEPLGRVGRVGPGGR
jgi:hypothetical protein